jgi:hypothetical protein
VIDASLVVVDTASLSVLISVYHGFGVHFQLTHISLIEHATAIEVLLLQFIVHAAIVDHFVCIVTVVAAFVRAACFVFTAATKTGFTSDSRSAGFVIVNCTLANLPAINAAFIFDVVLNASTLALVASTLDIFNNVVYCGGIVRVNLIPALYFVCMSTSHVIKLLVSVEISVISFSATFVIFIPFNAVTMFVLILLDNLLLLGVVIKPQDSLPTIGTIYQKTPPFGVIIVQLHLLHTY